VDAVLVQQQLEIRTDIASRHRQHAPRNVGVDGSRQLINGRGAKRGESIQDLLHALTAVSCVFRQLADAVRDDWSVARVNRARLKG
jgi:hypothetical protein